MRADPQRPFIIPVFIPHSGCPHQCVFCNQRTITGIHAPKLDTANLPQIIRNFLKFRTSRRREVQISFYGGTFLGLKPEDIRAFLGIATRFVDRGEVDSIRFSTRPDTIDEARLNILRDFPVSTIELGVQSMHDTVLQCSGRGHSTQDTRNAISLLQERHYHIGLQLMIGLPGDSEAIVLDGARQVARLAPDFIRIYPTVVLKGSMLARMYLAGRYTPLTLDQAVRQTRKLYLLFQHCQIPVIRMGLQASEALETDSQILSGPYHPAFGYLVFCSIFLKMALVLLSSASEHTEKELLSFCRECVVLRVHPRSISEMRGPYNHNLKYLKDHFHLHTIDVIGDASLKMDEIRVGEHAMSSHCLPVDWV
jgi:histone acetyltransferase (RNA polymerase elongator complex component)